MICCENVVDVAHLNLIYVGNPYKKEVVLFLNLIETWRGAFF